MITAPGCPKWEIKIDGKKSDIYNPDGTKTPGASCTWKKEGSGNFTQPWKGTCNDGSVMADAKYTAVMKVGSVTKSKEVSVDNTPPEIENIEVNESTIGVSIKVLFKDPVVNGISSGLKNELLNLPSSPSSYISITSNSNSVTINAIILHQFNNSATKALEILEQLKSILAQLKASDKVNNIIQFQNTIEWDTIASVANINESSDNLSFSTLAKGEISPHLNSVGIGGTIYNNFRCQRVDVIARLINPYELTGLPFNVVLRKQKYFNTSNLKDLILSYFYKGPEVARWYYKTNGSALQTENLKWFGYNNTGSGGTLVESGVYAFFIEQGLFSKAYFAPSTIIGQVNVVNSINDSHKYLNSQDKTNTPIKAGNPFSEKQKKRIKELNRARNGGVLRSDVWPYEILVDKEDNAKRKGVCNYAEVDHIMPAKPQSNSCAPAGKNEFENAQVIPRCLNNPKRNLFHY